MIKKISKHIRNHDVIRTIRKIGWKKFVLKNLHNPEMSEEEYLIGLGKYFLGYKMNLKKPKTFNEFINYYKLHYDNQLIYDLVDKIKVKEYLRQKNLENILIKTIKTYNSLDEVNFDELPNSFVIKNTQDSGGVFVCRDKSKISFDDIKNKLSVINSEIIDGKHWMLEKAYKYKNQIIVEELLNTPDGSYPVDYKILCYNGVPKNLFVCSERESELKVDFFDIDWNWLDIRRSHPNARSHPIKPQNFDQMLEIARILSQDFPFVRVDLYNIKGKIYFGELTFYPGAGFEAFDNYTQDLEFGKNFENDFCKK